MTFIRNFLIVIFSLTGIAFLFYVFYSQVVQPIAFPTANPPDQIQLLELIRGFFRKA